jgi:hypothetical protein
MYHLILLSRKLEHASPARRKPANGEQQVKAGYKSGRADPAFPVRHGSKSAPEGTVIIPIPAESLLLLQVCCHLNLNRMNKFSG